MVARARLCIMARGVNEIRKDRPMLALALRLTGIVGFGMMAALIKLASESGIHIAEIVFWRNFVSLPILLIWVFAAGGIGILKTQRPGAHAMRSLYGIVGMFLNFGAVILLPLAEATTMGFTAPIFAVILSIVLLRESVGLWRWSAVIAGFAGIVIIAQPFGGGNIPLDGAAVALGAAFMIALISIQIRDLGRTEKPLVTVFWFALASSVIASPALLLVHTPHSWTQYLLLAGVGITGTWGQLLITMALKHGQVASVIVMDYSSLFWATLYGWLIWNVLPGPWTWVGAPLIVGAGLVITWREHVLSQRQRAETMQAAGTRSASAG